VIIMNDENLIPLKSRTRKEQRAIQSKGGSSKSPKKKYASQLREMNKRGELGDNSIKNMVQMMEDPEYSIIDKKKYVTKALKAVSKNAEYGGMNIKDFIAVAKFDLELHKALFGDKMKLEHSGEVKGSIGISFGVDTSAYLSEQVALNKRLRDKSDEKESENTK